ncbi:MAG: N4-gp56 family major capsid protein [Pseudomonadota bacterium]
MPTTMYGDLTPRSAGAIARKLLDVAQPNLITEPYLMVKPIPGNSGQSIIHRRYLSFPVSTVPLSEGTPPAGIVPTFEDITIGIQEFGGLVEISNRIEELHEDDIPAVTKQRMAEQIAETFDTLRIGTLKGGSTVYYANGSARTDVNTPVNTSKLHLIKRYLKAQKAKFYMGLLKAGQGFNTEPSAPCFVALGHTDLEWDIRNLSGFVPYEQYSDSGAARPGEVGKVGSFRFCLSEQFSPWADGGANKGDSGTNMLSTTGVKADVYPVIILSPDAVCTTPLRGAGAITPFYVSPLKVSHSNKLGQRGHAGWRGWYGGGVLMQTHMVRFEVAATETPS